MQRRRFLELALLFLAAPWVGGCTTTALRKPPSTAKSTVLFLCPYGGAKSVIAASYFNQLVEQYGLPYTGVAAATGEPYLAVPPKVADHLEREGFDVRGFKPRRAQAADTANPRTIVSIDSDLAGLEIGSGTTVERWDDVPKLSEDFAASAAAIRRHVEALTAQLRSPR